MQLCPPELHARQQLPPMCDGGTAVGATDAQTAAQLLAPPHHSGPR